MDDEKKGKAYILTSKGKLVDAQTFGKQEIQKSSKQIRDNSKYLSEHQLVPHPYDLNTILMLYENSPLFMAVVNQIAEDAAGLGWNIMRIGEETTADAEEKAQIEALLNEPNPEHSFRDIMRETVLNLKALGFAAIEVVRRENTDKIAELWAVPPNTLYRRADKKLWCQVVNNERVWFKQFGDENEYDKRTGEATLSDVSENLASEIIVIHEKGILSPYYGVPKIVSAVGSAFTLIGIRDFNLAFFENYGVPEQVVLLKGNWEEGSRETLEKYFNAEARGASKAHKTLALEVPPGCEIEVKPIGAEVKEGSFKITQQLLREDILTAYSMPPYRIGIEVVGKLGGTNIQESTAIYKTGVIEPIQEMLEYIINQKIIRDGLGCQNFKLKFKDIDTRDFAAEVKNCVDLFGIGAITPNEIITRLGLGEGYEGGDEHFISMNYIQYETGEIAKGLSFSKYIDQLEDRIEKSNSNPKS